MELGSDMVAVFAEEQYGKEIVEAALEGLDLNPRARGQFY
jgi:hypothetical protein